MKKSLIFLVLLSSISCSKMNNDKENVDFVLSKSVYSGDSFYYLDKEDRSQVLKELYHATKSTYALWDIKKSVVNANGDVLFNNALSQELVLQDVSGDYEQAKANLQFFDRIRKLISSFKDTHFKVYPNISLPEVYSGLLVHHTKEGYIVYKKSDALLEYSNSQGYERNEKIELGDEVLSIDGVKVEDYAKNLAQYISSSSPRHLELAAADSLGYRNFHFPEKNYSDWEFKSKYGETYKVRLPWFYDDENRRLDVKTYFEKNDFIKMTHLSLKYDKKSNNWNDDVNVLRHTNGRSIYNAPEGLLGTNDWKSTTNDSSTPVRTGYFLEDGKAYGYLAIFDLHTKKLKNGELELEFLDVIKNFIQEIKSANVPLILDLRSNSGGSSKRSAEILSYIAKNNETYPSRTIAYRITRKIRQLFESFTFDQKFFDINSYESWQYAYSEFQKAIKDKKKYTNAILDFGDHGKITAHDDVGGYDLPVVALLDARCISACDNLARLIKDSKRAKIIGTTSNGTGAGYFSTNSINASWKDSYDSLKTRIPNYLFGLTSNSETVVIDEEDAYLKYNSENRPTKADIEYFRTKDDLLDGSTGWIREAINVLKSEN